MHKQLNCYTPFLFVLLTIFLSSSMLFSQSYYYDDETDEIRQEAEKRYLSSRPESDIIRYHHPTTIGYDEVVDRHIVVIEADLKIDGIVHGDVLVIWGNVDVSPTGEVRGDITSVDGTVYLHGNAQVGGSMLETNWRNLVDKDEYISSHYYHSNPSNYGTLRMPQSDNHLMVRYNRVEGAFLGFAVPKQLRYRAGHFSGYGFGGYGFETRKFRYQIGIDRWFFDPLDYRTELGAEYHDLTDTKDLWRIEYTENSVAAFFVKKDFHDYFRRRGYSAHYSQNITPFFQTKVEYRSDDYFSLSRSTNWALFGGDRDFRENPELGDDEGHMRSLYAQIVIDSRDHLKSPRKGFYLNVNGEKSAPDFLGGDFNYERYLAEVRIFAPMAFGETLRLRGIAGTSRGDLPLQKDYELGGISTLRGYDYKEFAGTRMFLANIEYVISTDMFGSFLGLDELDFIMFGDVGDIWSGTGEEGILESFRPLQLSQLKSAIGLALSTREGNIRLNLAKRTDRSDNAIEVFLRLQQPF